ncbi:hypothetical protein C900_01272 [Fulvivirga imtechensis AK7]|uniref:Activator of Hsp90 ATPase homologue 1/2-like C-terminal domain-containing protein n=1 Tax=Fulvivirga imtechensis AK7 TaxID=1237149 RepID=L8JKH1_9BACT|nr:SRPBCC domain-containing protein [Fulvivirga imtechensis]ELR68009.1 hypothetical protein C900_01272 [Fulvivirga imtechensis AK7]
MKRSINLDWFYPYPVEIIWDCLTDAEKLKEWSSLHKTVEFRAEVGFEWMEQQKPRKGWDGKMYFKVLEVAPCEKLVYSFKGGPAPGIITLDTVVTYRLESTNGGTQLYLEHTGFEGLKGVMTSFIMHRGWIKFFAKRLMIYLKQQTHEHSKL